VLQFCKENSLQQTFQTLQNECQVSLNTVDSLETFTSDINNGRWDALLPQVAQLKLPRKKLEDLYEQVRSLTNTFLFLRSSPPSHSSRAIDATTIVGTGNYWNSVAFSSWMRRVCILRHDVAFSPNVQACDYRKKCLIEGGFICGRSCWK